MFNTNINEKLLEKIELYESRIHTFWANINNWIDNPAPNNTSNINERNSNIQNAK